MIDTIITIVVFAVVVAPILLWLWCCLQLSLGEIEARSGALRKWWSKW